MESYSMESHFQTITDQRITFSNEMNNHLDHPWIRPYKEKWSIGETYYHLYLMVKRIRQLNSVYIPLMTPVASIRKKKTFKTKSEDVFKAFEQKHKRAMKAPFLLMPPKELDKSYTFRNLEQMLESETEKLKKLVDQMDERVAGQIYYPDPYAHYPNLIQSIHLIAIHEKHHFEITKKYFNL
ncbi:DinB family protein [Bacillus sp. FJAT-52991]|uniref:DinB family protein n=1 Tax=Bacillus kandeliae TaxID=3129297 RepID=A0ABZ2N8G2_9BACI